MFATYFSLAIPPGADAAPFIAKLPRGTAGQWCSVDVALAQTEDWWVRLELTDPARGQIVRGCFLGKRLWRHGRFWRATLVHIPAESAGMTLRFFHDGPQGGPQGGVMRLRRLGRAEAALRLLAGGVHLLPQCLRGARLGWFGRVRTVLGQAPARAGQAPPYAVWCALYEDVLRPVLPQPLDVAVAVCTGEDAALQATLASIAALSPAPACAPHIIRRSEDWLQISADWVLIVAAGEILAPDALAWFGGACVATPQTVMVVADLDYLDHAGARENPLFKPGADVLLAKTGLLAMGAAMVAWRAAPKTLPAAAVPARQMLVVEAGCAIAHVPRILTHLRRDAPAQSAVPIIFARAENFLPRVTAIVPSSAKSAHVVECVGSIANGTGYAALAVRVVVSAPKLAAPALLEKLAVLPRVEVHTRAMENFNYAAVNNLAAAEADSELLLLLNDDVAPCGGDWLDAMVAHMQDPTVGVVGARLLYGNNMVQHEGVIMGLADLCEHAGRLRPGADGGPHGLALLDRPVSAVTGAAMLVRRGLYQKLGGMDTNFAIALNDVDFCLRVRAAGYKVIYCAHAELHHYESLSLGRHYAGARAALESVEVRLLRGRWAEQIRADPFYNPAASLEPGREFCPGFPPRGPYYAA